MDKYRKEDNSVDWDKMWQDGCTKWDAGKSNPALVALFENDETRSLIPEHGQGLVPGCGSGYDVVFLANKNRHVTGIDLSENCIEAVNKNHPNASADNYDFMCADFFEFKAPNEGYDLAYDYTFLCALPPVLRPKWGARYKEIIKKGGVLITLMYPIEEKEGGPPYSLNEEVYKDLLSDSFELLYIKDPEEGHEARVGKEKIAIWKKK